MLVSTQRAIASYVIQFTLTGSQKITLQVYLEVIHGNGKRVHDFSIDGLILKVDQVHLLPDGLESSLRAESSQICTHMPMSLIGNLKYKNKVGPFATHFIQSIMAKCGDSSDVKGKCSTKSNSLLKDILP